MKNNITEFRKLRGLTQLQIAEALCVDYTQVQRWERDRRTPSVETAIRLARILKTTVEKLFIVDD